MKKNGNPSCSLLRSEPIRSVVVLRPTLIGHLFGRASSKEERKQYSQLFHAKEAGIRNNYLHAKFSFLDMQVYTENRLAFQGSKSPANSLNSVELPKSVVEDRNSSGKINVFELFHGAVSIEVSSTQSIINYIDQKIRWPNHNSRSSASESTGDQP